MAYSRWLDSHWYIFWDATGGPSKNEQLLAIWAQDKPSFNYQEVKSILKSRDASLILQRNGVSPVNPIPEEEWLFDCMERWVREMDRHFERKHSKT